MRELLLALVLLVAGAVHDGLGQEIAAATALHHTRTEHLLKAADHLEAAGLTGDARRIRQQVEREQGSPAAGARTRQAGTEQRQASDTSARPVLLKARVVEISWTKLRHLGFDLPHSSTPAAGISTTVDESNNRSDVEDAPTGLSYAEPRDLNDGFIAFVDASIKERSARVLAEPTLVTLSDRPAAFHAGGECRVAVPRGNGSIGVEERPYGTVLNFHPLVLDDQTIQMTIRIEVSEPDAAHPIEVAGEMFPVLRTVAVETGGEFRSGRTIVLGGLRQHRRIRSAPAVADCRAGTAPHTGSSPTANERVEEFETLVLITPEIPEWMATENTGLRIER